MDEIYGEGWTFEFSIAQTFNITWANYALYRDSDTILGPPTTLYSFARQQYLARALSLGYGKYLRWDKYPRYIKSLFIPIQYVMSSCLGDHYYLNDEKIRNQPVSWPQEDNGEMYA